MEMVITSETEGNSFSVLYYEYANTGSHDIESIKNSRMKSSWNEWINMAEDSHQILQKTSLLLDSLSNLTRKWQENLLRTTTTDLQTVGCLKFPDLGAVSLS